jgi:hypothetical protein
MLPVGGYWRWRDNFWSRYHIYKGIKAFIIPLALLPEQRGRKPGSRRTPKEKIKRNVIKDYRQFGSNRCELFDDLSHLI